MSVKWELNTNAKSGINFFFFFNCNHFVAKSNTLAGNRRPLNSLSQEVLTFFQPLLWYCFVLNSFNSFPDGRTKLATKVIFLLISVPTMAERGQVFLWLKSDEVSKEQNCVNLTISFFRTKLCKWAKFLQNKHVNINQVKAEQSTIFHRTKLCIYNQVTTKQIRLSLTKFL